MTKTACDFSIKAALTIICLALSMMAAKAQFYSLGDDPGRLRWRTFETPHYRIVYPRGSDSLALVYGNEFEKYVQAEAISSGMTLKDGKKRKFPLLIHAWNGISNAAVTWAPKRLDIFTLPSVYDPEPMPWTTNLAIHEGRHISQMQLGYKGVECMDEIPDSYDHDKICFVGNMRTLQNQDAVLHFVNDIFPLILKKKPGARFYIVGAEPPRNIMALSEKSENIVVTGFVDVLSDAVKDSCVAVAPVQIAAGIQNKVLVAMGMGVPVVMSSLISKAIPELESGTNCIIEDADQAFADACLRMMDNEADRNRISRSGYDTVRKYYSWQEKLSGYDHLNAD